MRVVEHLDRCRLLARLQHVDHSIAHGTEQARDHRQSRQRQAILALKVIDGKVVQGPERDGVALEISLAFLLRRTNGRTKKEPVSFCAETRLA